MLETEPLSRLLEEKWKKFASRIFFFNFVMYVLYLIVFTLVAYNKKYGQVSWTLQTAWLFITDFVVKLLMFVLCPTATVSPRTHHQELPVSLRPASDITVKLLFLLHRGK